MNDEGEVNEVEDAAEILPSGRIFFHLSGVNGGSQVRRLREC